jgi:hypothetical protein
MPAINRRQFIASTGAAMAAWSIVPSVRAQGDPLAGARLYADLVRYCEFGDHRTATDADHRTSRWLADQLQAAGVRARLSPWSHQQFFLTRHRLEVNGREIESFPLWWPVSTGREAVRGALAPYRRDGARRALEGRTGFVSVPPVGGASITAGNGIGEAVTGAARQGAVALVIVTQSPTGELVALNAMSGLRAWPIPVLLAGQKDEARLREAAAAGALASVLIDGRLDYTAQAFEVIGTLDRGPARIVVSTPSSGWFQCAGERGPGIALWLALARWAAANDRETSYTFVASSGHEMEAVGIRHFLGHDAPPPDAVRTWLHLGAGIATYDFEFGAGGASRLPRPNPARRLMTNQTPLMPVLEANFGGPLGVRPSLSDAPGGEMIAMAAEGYNVWGFAGGSAFHHMPGDTPQVTGPELLEPVARALARTLEQIATLKV